jgi:EmrB/QacA subfamily drug resistance transporter
MTENSISINHSASATPPPRPAKPERLAYKWKVLITVMFGLFMVILDTTVVNVAFQALRQEFGATLEDAQWIISVYVLSLGISMPLAGYLADRFGIKKVYIGGLSLFVLGSLLCGMSPNLGFLIAARTLQGVGGGLTLPLGFALILSVFPPEEQGTALGYFGNVVLVAPTVGPILGGYLVDQNLWRVIFFINPPIGLVGVVLGLRFLHDHLSDRESSFDFWGLVTEVIGFGAMLYAASIAATQGWSAPEVLAGFGIGIGGLIAFAVVELFIAKDPLLDLRLFTKRIFLNASLLGYVSVVALFGAEFLMPVYLQSLRGLTALETGLVLVPMAITGGISITLAGRLYDRFGPRPLLAAGFSILIVNTWQLSQLQGDTSITWIIFLLALRGIALGLTVQTTFVTGMAVVPQPQIPRASSLTNATRNVVQAVGVALLATVLASTLSPQVQALQNQINDIPRQANAAPVALCTTAPAATARLAFAGTQADPPANKPSQTGVPPATSALVQKACMESVAGFQRAYLLTFYVAVVALILGLMLPGWPFTWAGRRMGDLPVAGH